jgi:hypothetical protein
MFFALGVNLERYERPVGPRLFDPAPWYICIQRATAAVI